MVLGGSWLQQAGETVATLLSEMTADPTGRFAPSVYETGRLVSAVPSLTGHAERVRFLLDRQAQDGTWGGPGAYRIVPTLSATEAMLAECARPGGDPRAGAAADRGLRALSGLLTVDTALPDTVAVELIVPALAADIGVHLARRGGRPLELPAACYTELLTTLRAAAASGHALPAKLVHSLEVLGPHARGASFVRPEPGGVVGCSPAATAVWLGDDVVRAGDHPSVGYLRSALGPDKAVPVAAPLALFERAWVVSALADAGIPFTAPKDLVDSLHAAFGPEGAAGGLGLPPDADDTGTALHALFQLGSPRSTDCLWEYHAGDHFSCFPEERTPSVTANAHVLQALGAATGHGTRSSAERARQVGAAHEVTRWLANTQHADGSWTDKWHASPYYATACCATALAAYGGAPGTRAVRDAVRWVLANQRADGSWGFWSGTREETAYAVKILLRTGTGTDGAGGTAAGRAAARGCAYLLGTDGTDRTDHGAHEYPPLWHDKDLYTPTRIIDTEVFTALYLGHTDARSAPLLPSGLAATRATAAEAS